MSRGSAKRFSSSSTNTTTGTTTTRSSKLPMDQTTFKVTKVSYDKGEMTTINLPASEILKQTSILPRDLVSLNLTARHERHKERPLFPRPPTAILPRGTDSILLSFGHVRAVASRHSVVLFDAHRPVAKVFAQELSCIFASHSFPRGEPPELVFLEAVLRDTADTFQRRIRLYEPIVDGLLTQVSNEVFNEKGVHQLVPLKDSLQAFEMQVTKALQCLQELSSNDEYMLQLLITEQGEAVSTGKKVDFERHQHVELMLGGYVRQIGNTLQEVTYLLSRLQSKQEFAQLAMAGYRNRLVFMNVSVGIAGVSTGIATAIAGFFGMNLQSGLEDSTVAFVSVVAVSGLCSAAVAALSFSYLSGRTMQRRAKKRLTELETLTNALTDMNALDFTIKHLVDGKESVDNNPDHHVINRDDFKKALIQARKSGKASDQEVDFLFAVFDRVKDGQLTRDDFVDVFGVTPQNAPLPEEDDDDDDDGGNVTCPLVENSGTAPPLAPSESSNYSSPPITKV
jgi:magnesium transporter